VSGRPLQLAFDRERVQQFLDALERVAAGDTEATLQISESHDELDAIAFGVRVVAEELRWTHARLREAERIEAELEREQALRVSDARFATAFHSNPCAMTIVRVSDGRFMDVNENFVRQTGYARGDVIGRTAQEIGLWIEPDDLAMVVAAMRNDGRLDSREVRFRMRTGSLAYAVCSAEIIVLGEEPCVLATGLDVTDRRQAEIQTAVLREELAHRGRVTMVDALTGSIAHEINQPLTAVAANAEAALRMLENQPLPIDDLRETLEEIVSDNRRAGDVLLRMRSLLKKGATRQEPVEVNETVNEVARLIQGNATGRRIILDVELGAGIDPVAGDRIQIQQVVLNLLLNAMDAVQGLETVQRHVSLRTSRRDNLAVIDVTDRGHGLSDDALAGIFAPFFTTKRDGMGLGLSICQLIMGAHGGALEAMRNPSHGMTFSATFPMRPSGRPPRLVRG